MHCSAITYAPPFESSSLSDRIIIRGNTKGSLLLLSLSQTSIDRSLGSFRVLSKMIRSAPAITPTTNSNTVRLHYLSLSIVFIILAPVWKITERVMDWYLLWFRIYAAHAPFEIWIDIFLFCVMKRRIIRSCNVSHIFVIRVGTTSLVMSVGIGNSLCRSRSRCTRQI